jgi:tRNA 5-methylaminomethyl-2-thiouridine biosynthesis bifunctional protein
LSQIEAPALAALEAEMSGGATLVRSASTTFWVGATYEFDADGGGAPPSNDVERVHAGNLQRLGRLFAHPVAANPVDVFDATRCVARDRLPLAGAVADEVSAVQVARARRGPHLADLPRHGGLYASFAFGSRGLALAPLVAEWIAAQIEGEPWLLERDLAARFDVARFLLEVVRRG